MPEISIKVRGVEKVQEYLKTLPRGTVRVGLSAITEWFIGTMGRGLRHYQAYKYISRRQAYGQPFKSDRQRRYVMAAIREGRIDPGAPHRTGKTQRGYYAQESRGGYGMTIRNQEPGAYYTRDDQGQARLNALAGWLKTSAVIKNNWAGAIRHARSKVKEFLKKKGK